ncbi:MAG: D-alanyl-D-alanine carboxypeptidase family protein [Acidobacteriota bacterium]
MFEFKTKSPLRGLAHGCALVFCLVTINPGLNQAFGTPRARPLDPERVHARVHARVHFMDDDARVRLKAAIREMNQRGIRPRVNSTFRSHAEQRSIYLCARNRRCRARRGVYGARRPGSSMHEAGLAVDIGGVATGRRGRLTPKGRQTVRIMRKHGFAWRYGMKDPAHFEVSPRRAGYRTEQAAIKAGQRRWIESQRNRRQTISRRGSRA